MLNDTRTLKNGTSKISIVRANKEILFKHRVLNIAQSPISSKMVKVIQYNIRDL
jgi:hypothetical protein